MIKMKKSMTYFSAICILFLIGVIGGTVLANVLNRELMEQSGYFGTLFSVSEVGFHKKQHYLFLYVLKQRVLEVLMAWMVSLTRISRFCFGGLAVYCGGMIGMMISMVTYQKGVWGLFYYLATIFPQLFCYLPVWFMLFVWGGESNRPYRWFSLVKLLILIALGAILESYINPYLILYLLK